MSHFDDDRPTGADIDALSDMLVELRNRLDELERRLGPDPFGLIGAAGLALNELRDRVDTLEDRDDEQKVRIDLHTQAIDRLRREP
jgi:hypothetical protein